jgi:TPR repeat protein
MAIDRPAAMKLAYPLAVKGNPYAQYLVARAFLAEKQPLEAVMFMRMAADQGFPAALIDMGRFRANGIGAKADVQDALRWYARAAGAGHTFARKLSLQLLMMGARGRVARIGAMVVYPIAVLYGAARIMWTDTFSDKNLFLP